MKKITILVLFALILPLSSFAEKAQKNAVPANLVSFYYQTFDGTISAACTHKVANESNPYDLAVTCSAGSIKKNFIAHLALSRYRHTTAPKVTYELLYWVDGHGASSWYHFEEETKLQKVESSQSINGEDSALKLSITLQ